MITVPALKVRQFGVEFYQTSFTSGDIQKLVKFEVLNYSVLEEGEKRRKTLKTLAVNWEMLEKRIARSEAAFQRPMIRKKIRELVQYSGGPKSACDPRSRHHDYRKAAQFLACWKESKLRNASNS